MCDNKNRSSYLWQIVSHFTKNYHHPFNLKPKSIVYFELTDNNIINVFFTYFVVDVVIVCFLYLYFLKLFMVAVVFL